MSTQETITESGLRASASNLIPPGTPLVCTRMAVGRSAMAPMPTAINQDVKALIPSHGTDAAYLLRLLQYIQPKAAAAAVGSTVKGIRIQDYLSISVPWAPAVEQPLIVSILDTLDTTIRQTEAIIDKLKQVKQGLLHDLLTRGIADNGELRPPQSEAPHLYKASALGWIPKAWIMVFVGDEVDIRHGFAFQGDLFTAEPLGHRLLVPGNFSRFGGLEFGATNTKYFAGQYPPGTLLHTGEALIVMTDLSPMTLILGRVVLLNEDFPVLHNQRIGRFVFRRPSDWYVSFFVMLLNDERVRRKVIAEATGTTVRHTSPDRIKNGLVCKPGAKEQAEIALRVSSIQQRIRAEQVYVAKLAGQKTGLMDDLLTGRVRVTPLLEGVGR